MKTTPRTVPCLALAVLSLAFSLPAGAEPLSLLVSPVESPASQGVWPSLDRIPEGGAVMSWVESRPGREHALRTADFHAGRFGATRTVARGSGWLVNWADFPAIVAGRRGKRAATWLTRSGQHGYGIRHALSTDAGRSWEERGLLHSDESEAEHGFASLVPLAGSGIFAAWLDGRDWDANGMQLRMASLGGGGKLGDERVLDSLVCDCCQTSALLVEDGSVLVAYRNRSKEEVRDITVLRGRPGHPSSFEEVLAVPPQGWIVKGCPVNGPALAAHGEAVALAWFSGADGVATVSVTASTDFGVSFREPEQVDLGSPLGRVDVAFLGSDLILVTWLELGPAGEASWQARALSLRARELGPATRIAVAPEGRASGFLRLASLGSTVLAAWTGEDGVRVAEISREP